MVVLLEEKSFGMNDVTMARVSAANRMQVSNMEGSLHVLFVQRAAPGLELDIMAGPAGVTKPLSQSQSLMSLSRKLVMTCRITMKVLFCYQPFFPRMCLKTVNRRLHQLLRPTQRQLLPKRLNGLLNLCSSSNNSCNSNNNNSSISSKTQSILVHQVKQSSNQLKGKIGGD